MTQIVWDKLGERRYESGLDRGVLYHPDGYAVPWNGLTSITEKLGRETEAVYYDGQKISDVVNLGNFSATLKAITYPEEMDEFEGSVQLRHGLYLDEQPMRSFGLSWRTRIGNDVTGSEAGYKIHLLYNVTAIPSDKEFSTIAEDPEPVEFEWELSTVPVELDGYRPASHLVFKSADLDPLLLGELETMLYGDDFNDPTWTPIDELVAYLDAWYRVEIRDNGNMSFTADSPYPGYILTPSPGVWQIVDANVQFIGTTGKYYLSDTRNE